jgi:hypothetical protein
VENESKKDVPYHLKTLIGTVLEVNGIDLNRIKTVWAQQLSLQKVPGAAGVVYLEPDEYYIVVNVPVLVMPLGGRVFTYTELMHFAAKTSEIPTAQFAIRENVFYLTFCLPVKEVKENQVFEAVNRAITLAETAQQELIETILTALPPAAEKSAPSAVTLPNIKMTPVDAEVIYGLLASAPPHARKIYKLLMEQWEKAGFFVETTSSSVVLEIPYGTRRTRLGVLLWGGYAREPVIGLVWNALRKQTGFPPDALEQYLAAVKALAPLRTTPSAAYILVKPSFTITMGRQLIKLMTALAHSVRHDQVEPPTSTRVTSEENIELTLEQCPPWLRSLFRILIDGWRSVGGAVQCKKIGRIYLRMKTRHRISSVTSIPLDFEPEPLRGKKAGVLEDQYEPSTSNDLPGDNTRTTIIDTYTQHNFALAALVSPVLRGGPAIQLTWKLASGAYPYLGHIPQQVSRYEHLVSALPGFTSQRATTSLKLSEDFRDEHAYRLLSAMTDLLNAEESPSG